MHKKNRIKILDKILTRPANLSALIDHYEGVGRQMRERVGQGFLNEVFYLKNGFVVIYRLRSEVIAVRRLFISLFHHQPQKVSQLIQEFQKDYAKTKQYVDWSKEVFRKENSLSLDKVIETIEKFRYYYRKLWPPVLFCHWVSYWLEGAKMTKAKQILLQNIIKARCKRELEYVFGLEFFDNISTFVRERLLNIDCNLSLCTPEELIKILSNQKCSPQLKKQIFERENGCLYWQKHLISCHNSYEVNKFLSQFKIVIPAEESAKRQKSFRGQIACQGKAQGEVKLLFAKKDIGKIKKGDIIVSPMTTPYFGAVLEKAKAIITDEGGITCHAAIVSRELGIPCIIGTKIASKVLKDGDLVEVDAEMGVVKIVK